MIKLIAFLGNYGKKYEGTRHNAAWLLSGFLEITKNCSWQQKFNGLYSKIDLSLTNGELIHLIKPETFMNLSGESVGAVASFFQIKPNEILIVHDELELKEGVLSFKWSGGLGGHNGLRSIKNVLGTADFFRFRIGIGRPEPSDKNENADIASYVLSKFLPHELKILEPQFILANDFFFKLIAETEPEKLIKRWAKVLPEN